MLLYNTLLVITIHSVMGVYLGFQNAVDSFLIPLYEHSNAGDIIKQYITVTAWHLESLEMPLFIQQLADKTLEQANFIISESMMHIAIITSSALESVSCLVVSGFQSYAQLLCNRHPADRWDNGLLCNDLFVMYIQVQIDTRCFVSLITVTIILYHNNDDNWTYARNH